MVHTTASPKVFEDYIKSLRKDGNFRYMGSDIFFHSLEEGENCEVKLGEGKVLIVKLTEVRPVNNEGYREAIFEVNGNRRIIKIKENLNRIMAERCHKPLEQVMQDTERDNFMSAEEARAYGLIDRVITHRE